MKKNTEPILNRVTSDASVRYEEDGSVSIRIAPWHYAHEITEKPKSIRGRMVFRGKNNEGDGGKFLPSAPSGRKLYTLLCKTPHGEMKSTQRKVMVSFTFWKTEGKLSCLSAMKKEIEEISNRMLRTLAPLMAAHNEEDIAWEELKA